MYSLFSKTCQASARYPFNTRTREKPLSFKRVLKTTTEPDSPLADYTSITSSSPIGSYFPSPTSRITVPLYANPLQFIIKLPDQPSSQTNHRLTRLPMPMHRHHAPRLNCIRADYTIKTSSRINEPTYNAISKHYQPLYKLLHTSSIF